jgi:hypothetical protein
LIEAMRQCEQMPGLSILAHGEMVHEYYLDLRNHILNQQPLRFEWRLPEWIASPALWGKRLSESVLEEYAKHHDCSKMLCREVDQEGRVHFPNHAALAEQTWLKVGGDPQAARLMGMDMDIHLLKAEGLAEFCGRPEAASLLITGLCEVHANASMFGGINSTSFKMKWKHIDRRGKQIALML